MQKVLVTVSINRYNERQIRSLETIIRQNYKSNISFNRIIVIWKVVSKQQHSSLHVECKNGITQYHKTLMIKNCERDWAHVTGLKESKLSFIFIQKLSFYQLFHATPGHLRGMKKFLSISTKCIRSLLNYLLKGYWIVYDSI